MGVILNSVLLDVAYEVQVWLGRIGGAFIIAFGLYLLGLIEVPFLETEHKIRVKRRFRYSYLTSIAFGATFAVGWTPCVGAILGSILALAVATPVSAFSLLTAYSIGLGIPFLLAGAFIGSATRFVEKSSSFLKYFNLFAGILLIIIGILVFTNNLIQIANFPFLDRILQ